MEQPIGHSVSWLNAVDSTNEELARRIRDGSVPAHGQVIVASDQTNGKGLGENTWESEPGKNLTFSFSFKPDFLDAGKQFYLNIFVSMGVYHFVKSVLQNHQVKIKWPNDIYAGNQKIAGILIQNAISGRDILYSIAGIGLNVNQMSFPAHLPNPISLKQAAGKTYDLEKVLRKLLESLNYYYLKTAGRNFEECRKEYKKALFGHFQWLKFKVGNEVVIARITGVSETGLLQLEKPGHELFECDLKEIAFLV